MGVGGVGLGRAAAIHQDAVRGGSGRAVQLARRVDDRRLRNGPRAALNRAVSQVGRQTGYVRFGMRVRREVAGHQRVPSRQRRDALPLPVSRRNLRVVVVLPATRDQAGVALAAIRSPSTGEATAVSGCVALTGGCAWRHRTTPRW